MNETLGWVCITLGFISGAAIGMFFHRADWLGGYAAYPRRMLRLGHIALIALGGLNVLFSVSAAHVRLSSFETAIAAWGMALGAVLMPAACAVAAWRPSWKPPALFFVPAASLIVAGVTVVRGLVQAG